MGVFFDEISIRFRIHGDIRRDKTIACCSCKRECFWATPRQGCIGFQEVRELGLTRAAQYLTIKRFRRHSFEQPDDKLLCLSLISKTIRSREVTHSMTNR